MKFFDRVYVATATTGQGTLTLGDVVSGNFMTPVEAGVTDADQVTYVIEEGADFEIGTGVIGGSGTTLTRATVYVSKIAGTVGTSKMELAGTAKVFLDNVAATMNDWEGRAGFFQRLPEVIKTDASNSLALTDAGKAMVANRATAITFNLPSVASSASANPMFFVRNIGAGQLTIDGNSSETIEGATTITMLQGEAAILWLNEGDTAWRATRFRSMSQEVQAASAKSTPIGADRVGLFDNAAGYALKYLTWDALKAAQPIARREAGLTPHENLVVKYVSATSVDIDADAVVLFDSTGSGKRFAAVNLTAAITTSGANGRDTGSEGSSRWYHIFCIGKDDGTIAALLSESATAPTLPATYTFMGYVGAVYNNSSSDFVSFWQHGNRVTTPRALIVTAGTQTSFTTVDLSTFVPPTAASAIVDMQIQSSSGTNSVQARVAPAGSGTTATYAEAINFHEALGASGMIGGPVEVPIITAQQIVYRVQGTSAQVNIQRGGWAY